MISLVFAQYWRMAATFSVLLTFLVPVASVATQIHVPADYATIQAAINAATDGDTVFVGPGTYVENITFMGKDVLLRSTGGAVATSILPANLDKAIVSFVNGESRAAVISGFRIANSTWRSGVECFESSPTIEYCEFLSCVFVANMSAPLLATGSAPAVIGNTFRNNQNSIYPNGPAACIELHFVTGPSLVEANEIYDNICGGILIQNGVGPIEIAANRIYRNDGGIVVNDLTAGCKVHNNIVHRNSGTYGLTVMGTTAAEFTIKSNTFWKNRSGLYLDVPAQSTVRAVNNIIANSDVFGIKDDRHFAFNNVLSGNAADFSGVAPSRASYFSCNPRFVSSISGDLSLSCESPAIDLGVSPTLDPDGSSIDIGALPYVHNQSTPNVRDFTLLDSQPLQIGRTSPIFSWSASVHSVRTQMGFELQVGTDQDWVTAELMSTGELVGADSTFIYTGPTLMQGAIYFARMRIRDENGWSCWRETVFRRNLAPSIPRLLAPTDDSRLHPNGYLTIDTIADDELDSVRCEVEVFSDAGLNNLVYSDTVLQDGTDDIVIGPVPALVSGQAYWWRARAADSRDTSNWSNALSFLAEFPRAVMIPDEIPTVQQAVSWAIDGDTLLLAPGTYTCPFSLKQKALAIVGRSGPDATRLVPLDNHAGAFDDLAPDQKATVFEGLCFDQFSDVFITRGRTEIVNCRFVLKPNSSSSPHIFVTTPTRVSGCEFLGPAGIAIGGNLDSNQQITIVNSRFVLNTPDYSWRPIIFFWKPTYATDFRYQVYIRNNLFVGEHDNTIIELRELAQGEISNNTLVDFNYAIDLDQGNGVAIKNNTFSNCDHSAIVSYSTLSDYNNFWNVVSHYANGSTAGAHDISVDPQFVDADNGDFRLQCSSLCIDAGDPATEGCKGKRIDIGAFEYDYLVGNASGNTTGNPINITDAVFLINYLFVGGAAPCPLGAGQIDCDAVISIGDAVALINYLFAHGPAPCSGCQ